MVGRGEVRAKLKSLLNVRSELGAESAVSHLKHSSFICCLASLSEAELESVVIQFSLFSAVYQLQLEIKILKKQYEFQDGDKKLTLSGKYWVNIPLQGVVKYFIFAFI